MRSIFTTRNFTLSLASLCLYCSLRGALSVTPIVPFDGSCDARPNCSPDECVATDEQNCEFGKESAIDWASEVFSLKCNDSCEPSSQTKCSQLGSILKTNAGIRVAYCNADFLVVWASGFPRYDPEVPVALVPFPPAGMGDEMCRIRTALELLYVYKIPLETAIQTGSNTVFNPLPGVEGLPAAGAMGMALDGVPIYPNYNNRGLYSWTSCEADYCNAHIGGGQDYHYHGDPFGTRCLYSETDFSGLTHPPLLGYAFDGFEIYGRHVAGGLEGEDVDLDECGGHDHGDFGYHYHAHTLQDLTTNELDGVEGTGPFNYTAYLVAPTECWKGNINVISNFWDEERQVNYDRSRKDSQDEWEDLEELRPCCGTSDYYAVKGIVLNDGCNLEIFGKCVCDIPLVNLFFFKWCFLDLSPATNS